MEITNDLLKKLLPQSAEANRQKYLPYFNKYLAQYGIKTDKQVAAFFAQIGHESVQLRYSEEIASGAAYEGRKDLGNTQVGDGIRFKGRGLIQITGRSNYQEISNSFGVDFINSPQLLSQPEWSVRSACWWWKSHGLNEIADLGDFRKITKIINGGYNGWDDRYRLWLNAIEVLK